MASGVITPSFYLSLALLTVPVRSYPAARDVRVDLKNLHKKCAEQGLDAGLNMLKKCSQCQDQVPEAEIIKGYRDGDGYTFLSPEEIKILDMEKSKAMEIAGFVDWEDIDPVYLGSSNWLGPVDVATSEAYCLIQQAMLQEEKAAIVRYVQNGRDKVGFLRATPEAIMLFEGFYAAEVKSFDQQNKLPIKPRPLAEAKAALATQLVQKFSKKFTPEMWAEYTNGYEGRVRQLIADRKAGVAPTVLEAPTVTAGAADLMALLQASLGAAAPAPAADPGEPQRKAPTKAEATPRTESQSTAQTRRRKSA